MASLRLLREIKRNRSTVFRRIYIRRMRLDGSFEDDWVEISRYVKKWGKVTKSIDPLRYAKFKFNGLTMNFDNQDGLFNDQSDENSLWYGFASQQRTLVKIEFGLKTLELSPDGIWQVGETGHSLWDSSLWDAEEDYDAEPTKFNGIISGDILKKGDYEVPLPIQPLEEVFRGFPASKIQGYTSTGVTASKFIEMVRDATDGAANFLFRPFFGNTSTNWLISSTSNIYADLNTSGSEEIIDKNIWQVMEKLAEAEDFILTVSDDGQFKFVDRGSNTITSDFKFFGLGFPDREYGHTIKKIESYGPKFTNFYTRVQVKFNEEDTITSYVTSEMTITASGTNFAWVYGHRPLNIENYFIAGSTIAAQIADNIFNNVSALKNEIVFSTPFLVGVDVLDQIEVSYDSNPGTDQSLWDLYDWGDDTAEVRATDLIFDTPTGDNIFLNGAEFRVISIETDLDNLGVRFIARET